MRVLVTGGCGFLGANVTAHFLGLGAEVVVMDAHLRKGAGENLEWLKGLAKGAQLAHYRVDTADDGAVESVFARHSPFEFICHFAGQVAMTTSMADPRRDFLTNAVGTFNVLEAARKHSPGAFLAFSSTNKVYGDLEWLEYEETPTRYVLTEYPNGFPENLPLDFSSPYGCSKGCADQYVRDWYRNYGLKTVVFRHSSIYGGRQYATFDQGWMGWFCQQAIHQKRDRERGVSPAPFTISGNGKQVRDVLHAHDLVQLYELAFRFRGKLAGNVYNIGAGMQNSLSLIELIVKLEQRAGERLLFRHLPPRPRDQRLFVADLSLISSAIDWTPNVGVDEGLARMWEWIDNQPLLQG